MSTGTEPAPVELDVDGAGAPPRSNGELVFDEPWEGRAFGLVMALVDGGALSYAAFRDRLIATIGAWEAAHPDGAGYRYYACWLQALEQCLDAGSLVGAADVGERAAALAARPVGHDHRDDDRHGHGHGHGH